MSYSWKERRLHIKRILESARNHILLAVIAFSIVVGISNLIHRYGAHAYLTTERALGGETTSFLIGLVVLCLGLGAATFKHKNKEWYGLVEFIFGLASAYSIAFSMAPEKSTPAQWASLVGSAYVIARGAGNMSEAYAEKQRMTAGVEKDGAGI